MNSRPNYEVLYGGVDLPEESEQREIELWFNNELNKSKKRNSGLKPEF